MPTLLVVNKSESYMRDHVSERIPVRLAATLGIRRDELTTGSG